MASISCVAKGRVSNSPFSPRVFRISWVAFQSFDGICSALRVEVGCTSIALYLFSSISLFNFIALKASFLMAARFGGSTLYPFLIISLSAFLKNSPFFGRLKGASMAMSVGWFLSVFSKISLSVWSKSVFTVVSFSSDHPVGFLLDPAKSIPITHLSLSSNIVFQVYICDL